MTDLLRYRAKRDLAYCRRRLADLQAAGPQDNTATLGEVLRRLHEPPKPPRLTLVHPDTDQRKECNP